MKYVVELEGKRIEVAIDGDQVSVDGAPAERARLSDVEGTPVRLVTIGDAVHRVTARRDGQRGSFALKIDGRRYAVEALDERTRAMRNWLCPARS
jgi:hypothetical protein